MVVLNSSAEVSIYIWAIPNPIWLPHCPNFSHSIYQHNILFLSTCYLRAIFSCMCIRYSGFPWRKLYTSWVVRFVRIVISSLLKLQLWIRIGRWLAWYSIVALTLIPWAYVQISCDPPAICLLPWLWQTFQCFFQVSIRRLFMCDHRLTLSVADFTNTIPRVVATTDFE